MANAKYGTIPVRSRCAFRLRYQFDGEIIEFGPRETLHLTLDAARHVIRQSRVKWDPITQRDLHALYEVKPDVAAPADLSWEEAHPTEVLDRSAMPPTHFDDDGNPITAPPKVLRLGEPLLRGREPGGLTAVPEGFAAGDDGRGASQPLEPELRDRLRGAHETLADVVAQDAGLEG